MAGQSTIFAGVAGYVGRHETGSVGVFRRGVGDDKWNHVLTHLETYTVLVHPTEPSVGLAGTADGVWRSTDGGETWEDCSADLTRLSELPHLKSKIVSDTFAEGMLDGHAIAISSADADAVVLACRMGLFRSADRGRTWQDMEMKKF